LHLISRDGDFKSLSPSGGANFFLCSEWSRKKEAQLYIYNGLSEFVKAHFPDIIVPSDAIKAAAIEQFLNSSSFSQTHQAVSLLMEVKEELDDDERILLLTASTKNPQIYSIINDDDVKSLLHYIYEEVSLITSTSLDKALNELSPDLGVPF